MDTSIVIFICLGLLLPVSIVVYIVVYNRHEEFAQTHSQAIAALKQINTRYTFFTVAQANESASYDNQKLFEQISCRDYLIYQLQSKKDRILEQIRNANRNRARYASYLTEIRTNCPAGRFGENSGRYVRSWLLNAERRAFSRLLLKRPTEQFDITVILLLLSQSGYVRGRKRETFGEGDIRSMIDGLNRKRGTFYLDRDIWEALCRVERGRVSNRMRFAVLQRDGYRCRWCGRGQGSVTLEIDHIIPISKGGKSDFDNLQTLCRSCNLKKGDSMPWKR